MSKPIGGDADHRTAIQRSIRVIGVIRGGSTWLFSRRDEYDYEYEYEYEHECECETGDEKVWIRLIRGKITRARPAPP